MAADVDDAESLTTEDVSRHVFTRGHVLVAVLVSGLVAVVVTGAVSMRGDSARDASRQDLVDGASAGALALVDIHVDTVDEDVAQLRALSTGEFAEELVGDQSGFVNTIRSASVNSDAKIDAAALSSEAGAAGVVLIAASAQVANSAGETTSRTYRLRIGVEEVDGKILMSSVEFVP